ncbi:SMODS domain-containing nucleotidyltransferase [Bacillus atrophaeus]|uniref:SMODS domain-containing nucleotidyltransferase n=1 Tax=Bacillus atrophaeus TaxID=1452 RepID=UPI003D1BC1BC
MGTYANFEKFVKDLRTTNDNLIKIRKESITKRINKDFRNLDSSTGWSRFVGSYGRGTATKGVSDIDILIELPQKTYDRFNSYIGNKQSALLQEVRRSISTLYPTTKIGGDGQVVVVEFHDMTFEILPAFRNIDNSFTYPDSNNGGRWKTCKPIHEINAINEQNKKYNKKIKHLVRMMKTWKETNNVPIGGLLIETLAMNFMKNWEYNDKSFVYYDWMIRDFLYYLSEQDKEKSFWKAWGSGQYVWRKGVFENKARSAYEISIEAIRYSSSENLSLERKKWGQIFGSSYRGLA